MKKLISFLFLAAFVAVGSSAEIASVSVAPILKNFPSAEPEAVYRNVEKIYRFAADGSCDVRTKTELRVNTLFAMNELCGETFVVYNPKFQRVKINEAYTLSPDGTTRTDVPENALNEVLPAAATNAPAFNFLRELVITHTALEPGATIFLDYTVHYRTTEGIVFDDFPDMPFPCERLFFDFNGATTERFDVPARSREANFEAKKSVPAVYPGMSAAKTKDFDAEKAVLSASGKKIAVELAGDSVPRAEKIFALAKFVREKIATVPVEPELLNFELRAPDAVLASAYGVPAEKAILLKAMLAAIGENSSVEVAEKHFFVRSPSAKCLLAIDAKTPSFEKFDSRVLAEVKLGAGKESYVGSRTFSPLHATESDVLARVSELGLDEKTFTKIGASEDFSETNRHEFAFSGTRKILPASGIIIWTPPHDKKGLAASGFDKLPSARQTKMRLPNFCDETYSYLISPEDGVEFVGVPIKKKFENAAGTFILKIVPEGKKVSFFKSEKLKNREDVLPENYPAFRELMIAWFAPESNRVLFRVCEKKSSAGES